MRTILFLLLLTGIAHAQKAVRKLEDNGIYLTAEDYQNGILTHAFKKTKSIKFNENKKSLISIKSADSSFRFYYDEIWGYRKDEVDWRVVSGSAYQVDQVDQTGKIYIYTLPICVACLTTPPLYFSADLTSPIHPLTRNDLMIVFHSDTGFINKLKQLPWTTSIIKRNKRTGNFRFIEWL